MFGLSIWQDYLITLDSDAEQDMEKFGVHVYYLKRSQSAAL